MKLAKIVKGINCLEHWLRNPSADSARLRALQSFGQSENWLGYLQELARTAERIKEKAQVEGDDRTALLAVGELRKIAELSARLKGQLAESRMNIVQVHVGPETAARIARTYLARHPHLEE